MLKHLKTKITNKKAVIGIVGLGYVGLPLAEAFSKNFNIIGYDLNKQRIIDLKNGKDTNLINNKIKIFRIQSLYLQIICMIFKKVLYNNYCTHCPLKK